MDPNTKVLIKKDRSMALESICGQMVQGMKVTGLITKFVEEYNIFYYLTFIGRLYLA
jgi:hypothetical protein